MEAISPTLPQDDSNDDMLPTVKTNKEELLQNIHKVDREISKLESQIAKLKKKQVPILNILFMAPEPWSHELVDNFNLLWTVWSLMSKMSTTFRSVSYGPCSEATHVTPVREQGP